MTPFFAIAPSGRRLRLVSKPSSLVLLATSAGRIAMLPASWDRLQARVIATLDAFHTERPDVPGIGLEQLRRGDKALLPPPVFLAAIKRLARGRPGGARSDVGAAALPPGQVLRGGGENLGTGQVQARARAFSAPRVRDIATAMHIDETFVRRLLRMAARRGDADEIAHDHFFLRSVVQSMAEIAIDVAAHAPEGRFTAAQFRDRLDNGRKVAIQILEFFDRHGFTIRRQDMRRINPARIELFAPNTAGRQNGGVPLPVGRPDFKSGWGRQTVSGGFDSHPPPPTPFLKA